MSETEKKSYFIRRMRIFCKRNYATVIALLLLGGLYFYTHKIEPDQLKITEYDFYHEKVTPELDGVVIAFVSDIHATERRIPLWQKAMNAINQTPNVEAILLGGDLINGNSRGIKIDELLNTFSYLKNPSVVFSVSGNHEYRYRHGGIKAIRNAFNKHGFKLMQDDNIVITTANGSKFNLIGLDFMTNPHDRINQKRTEKLFREDMLNIVLTHTPEDFPFLPEKAHLSLVGHTHGGQLHIPLLGSVIKPPGYPRKYSYGKIKENNKTMFVTSGLGSAYTQARLFMKPEVVFITLKMANKK